MFFWVHLVDMLDHTWLLLLQRLPFFQEMFYILAPEIVKYVFLLQKCCLGIVSESFSSSWLSLSNVSG